MLNRVSRWLERLNQAEPSAAESDEDGRLAAAVLLVEAAHLDGNFDASERETIRRALARHFDLSGDETGELMALAEATHADSVELSRFTRAIKEAYEPSRRVEIVEMLWEVVLADGDLHAYEANLLRRIGGLIYVSDRENGEARQRVLARLGRSDG